MYLIAGYFVECLPELIPGHGWTCAVRISRQDDYRRAGKDEVHKQQFEMRGIEPTRRDAERVALEWARRLVGTLAAGQTEIPPPPRGGCAVIAFQR
jgi:hypothetical protein